MRQQTDRERLILMQEVRLIRLCARWKMSWLTKEKRKAMDSAQKKSVKSSLSYVKKLISRTKPGNVSEEQAAEIKHAADELRNAAAGLI